MSAPSSTQPGLHLLAVTGSSPAVISETLYVLAVAPGGDAEPKSVTAVDLVTTTHGRDHVHARLPAALASMARDNPDAASRLPLASEALRVTVPRRADGSELDDIRDTADAALAADAIVDLTRRLCDGAMPLHASLAGGRKTMSYILGQAMSLWARPSDRLSHVLVSEPADQCRDFFYPTPRSEAMVATSGAVFDASTVEIQLHEVAFPRLRELLASVAAGATFWATVEEAQARLTPLPLCVNFRTGSVRIGREEVRMKPVEKALFMILATERKHGRSVPRESLSDPQNGSLARVARWIYRDLLDVRHHTPFFDLSRDNDEQHGPLKTNLSRIRAALMAALPETVAHLYLPSYGGNIELELSPDLIEVVGGDEYARVDPRTF